MERGRFPGTLELSLTLRVNGRGMILFIVFSWRGTRVTVRPLFPSGFPIKGTIVLLLLVLIVWTRLLTRRVRGPTVLRWTFRRRG